MDELARYRGGLEVLKTFRYLSAHVLKIAGGFHGEEVPTLPPFYKELPPPETQELFTEYAVPEMGQHFVDVRLEGQDMDAVVLKYSEVNALESVIRC